MKKYILFGAGTYGKKAVELLEQKNILCFTDNNPALWGQCIDGIPVKKPEKALNNLSGHTVIITAGGEYEAEIIRDLEKYHIQNYSTLRKEQQRITLKNIQNRPDNIKVYKRAVEWIQKHSIPGQGICVSSQNSNPYPEVSGYFIPT